MTDVEDFLAERSRAPAAQAPSTIGEIWSANWAAAGFGTAFGVAAPVSGAYDELQGAVEAAHGKPLGELARDRNLTIAASFDHRVRTLHTLADELPEEQRKAIEPLRDVRKRAAEKAQQTLREASDVNDRAYGLSANAVRFAAGIARTSIDPVNIAAMVATAPIGGPFAEVALLPFLARQGLAGMAAQALQEPMIQAGRAELGLDSGFLPAIGDIAEAGIGAVGLSALLKGGAAGLRLALRREAPAAGTRTGESPGVVADPSAGGAPQQAVHGRLDQLAPEDLLAAARLAERDQLFEGLAVGNAADHSAHVQAAADAIEAGRPISQAAAALEREGARLPGSFERLSELQLGEIARNAATLEEGAGRARSGLERENAQIATGEINATSRAEKAAAFGREVETLKAEIADVARRIETAADPITAERLAAIEAELKRPAVRAERRADLEAERATITETLAATAGEDARLRASLAQEHAGLQRHLARVEKLFNAAAEAHAKAEKNVGDRGAAAAAKSAAIEANLAANREIVGNELRRAVARLASEGYGVRLAREEAGELADLLLLATPEQLPAVLRNVTEHLVDKNLAARGDGVDRLAIRLQGLARRNNRELDKATAAQLAGELTSARGDEVFAILDRVTGRPPPDIALADMPLPETAKAPAAPLAQVSVVESAVRGRAEGQFVNFEIGDIGILTTKIEGDALTVAEGSSFVKGEFRGQGHGLAMYEKAIAWAQDHGLVFRSDFTVSEEAVQIYRALERRGYAVTEQTETRARPRFEVTGAAPAPVAAPARTTGGAIAREGERKRPDAFALDAQRVMAEAGDLDIHLPDADGNIRKVSAADALAALDEDGAAAREFEQCIAAAAAAEVAQ